MILLLALYLFMFIELAWWHYTLRRNRRASRWVS